MPVSVAAVPEQQGSARPDCVQTDHGYILPSVAPVVFWVHCRKYRSYRMAEINFKSILIYFKGEGTYTESKLSYGMAITDSARSENVVVRTSIAPTLIVSDITSCTFACLGPYNLKRARYVMDMRKADAVLDEIVKGIRGFLESRQVIANAASEKDIDSMGNLYNLNRVSPAANLAAQMPDPILGAAARQENSLGSGSMQLDAGPVSVAMCVNDVITTGAKPLFFLDYFACGKLDENIGVDVIKGIAQGCTMAKCALVGGETAEMPSFYPEGEYDLAGFCVGVAEKEELLNPETVSVGDAVIGLASSGLHSNGYSLVRKIFFEQHHFSVNDQLPELGKTLGEELLTPTLIYVRALELLQGLPIKAAAHITGGGCLRTYLVFCQKAPP